MLIKRYKQEDLNKSYDANERKSNLQAKKMDAAQRKARNNTLDTRKKAADANKKRNVRTDKPKGSSELYKRSKEDRIQDTDRAAMAKKKSSKRYSK